eukprot:scaffold4870_cov135-Cylindrotheca_fusiformis.AAC.8
MLVMLPFQKTLRKSSLLVGGWKEWLDLAMFQLNEARIPAFHYRPDSQSSIAIPLNLPLIPRELPFQTTYRSVAY